MSSSSEQLDVTTPTNQSSSAGSSPEPDSATPARSCLFQPADEHNKNLLHFREILQLFNCAISQEQAWAVLYTCLVEVRQLLGTHLDLVKLNSELIDINMLSFTKEGTILFRFKNAGADDSGSEQQTNTSNNNEQERQTVEAKVLKSIAYLIFDALDYGNTYSSEPVLQTALSHLLLMISGHFKEFNNGGGGGDTSSASSSSSRVHSEDDEGYEQEEDAESVSLDKAIEICVSNVAEADYHYRAVCRGLYVQAFELKVFLAKIEDSKVSFSKL
jgi:hypothetical protein